MSVIVPIALAILFLVVVLLSQIFLRGVLGRLASGDGELVKTEDSLIVLSAQSRNWSGRLTRFLHGRAVRKYFPDALDLILICREAGLGLDAAIQRVSDEMATYCPELNIELKRLGLEIRSGVPRVIAFENFSNRLGEPEVEAAMRAMTQADRFGTNVSDALRVQGELLRLNRRLRAEERAARIPTQLLFPLIFLIFPSLLLVLIGPVSLTVMDHF
jgi:tight adherence protein C